MPRIEAVNWKASNFMENEQANTSNLSDLAEKPSVATDQNIRSLSLPPTETAYLQEIVKRLQQSLNTRLLGVYLFGSASYGAYEPGISDLDIQAIVAESLSQEKRLEIARSLSGQNLPCPASKLEFVCYALSSVNPASRHPRFELNLNTANKGEAHLTLDPSKEPSHWFLLDIAMGREQGLALYGPDPANLFAPIPRLWTLEAIEDSLIWHREHELTSANSVLNACRGWRYIETAQFGSKLAGAEWAIQQPDCPPVVKAAIEARHNGTSLPSEAVLQLYELIMAAVRVALCGRKPR